MMRQEDSSILLVPRPKSVRFLSDRLSFEQKRSLLNEWQVRLGNMEHPFAERNESIASQIDCKWVTDLPKGAYRLSIDYPSVEEFSVKLEAADESGKRHALMTFAQLLRVYRDVLPPLVIEDRPSFPVRGFMLDISRDRVPTMEHLYRIADMLASLKFNHLQLYTEHTFSYAGHETVWKAASPMTPDEIRDLDLHCKSRGIILAANQNCFGHMERWLKHPEYASLAETVGEWEFMEQRREGPFSLCPVDPGSVDLIADLLGQLLPNFSSNLVNIGCDETFDVGQGRSKQLVEATGFPSVYWSHVRKVVDIARSHDFQPMFWADMALSHPESLSEMPEDLTALIWGYEPDSPFDDWCQTLAQSDNEFWVCPGTSSWRSITGRTTERRENLRAAATAGLKHGAAGLMVTDWGDMGHRQQWPITLTGLFEAANAAWNPDAIETFDPRTVGIHGLIDDSGLVGRLLYELGDVDYPLRRKAAGFNEDGTPKPSRNQSALFADLHESWSTLSLSGEIDEWMEVRQRLDELETQASSLSKTRSRTVGRTAVTDDRIFNHELRHAIAVASFATDRAIRRRSKRQLGMKEKNAFRERMKSIIEEHRKLWSMRSRPGGLEDSCRYYEQISADVPS